MEKLVSNWYTTVPSLPESYAFPPGTRPGRISVPLLTNIPIIDLSGTVGETCRLSGDQRLLKVAQIRRACQEFGFFQVVNHGVPEALMKDAMGVFDEFFRLPDKDRESLYSEDPTKPCRLHTSSYDYAKESVHFWRDNVQHHCNPLHEYIHSWPEKPTRYRDVVGKYSVEVRNLALRILELIAEGLGLKPTYFGGELTQVQLLSANHYPPCPDPSLALGLPKHADPDLITLLLQGDVYGLQVFKDGQWLGVQPIPNAFVVNIGLQLEVISNGKIKCVEHRAVTNSTDPRTTIVSFINPCYDAIIEPAKALVDKDNPRLYRPAQSKEFVKNCLEKKGYTAAALDAFLA